MNLQQYNKAFIALLAPALVAIGARYGMNLSIEEAAILASLVTGVIVYLVPNKANLDHNIESYTKALEMKVRQQIDDEIAQAQHLTKEDKE